MVIKSISSAIYLNAFWYRETHHIFLLLLPINCGNYYCIESLPVIFVCLNNHLFGLKMYSIQSDYFLTICTLFCTNIFYSIDSCFILCRSMFVLSLLMYVIYLFVFVFVFNLFLFVLNFLLIMCSLLRLEMDYSEHCYHPSLDAVLLTGRPLISPHFQTGGVVPLGR